MKMKQATATLLATAVMTAAIPCISASAADTVAISVGDTTAAAGSGFSVDVSIADIPATGLCAVEFAVEFDASLVSIDNVTAGALCDTGADSAEGAIDSSLADTVFDWNVIDNQICVSWATGLTDSSYWLQDGGVFVTIEGTVSSDATAGATADFSIVPITRDSYPGSGTANSDIIVGYLDNSGTALNYASSVSGGTLTVSGDSTGSVFYGDVDCNGTINVSDVVFLSRYIAQDATYTISPQGLENADCDGNGSYDSADIGAIGRYLVGLLATLGPQ